MPTYNGEPVVIDETLDDEYYSVRFFDGDTTFIVHADELSDEVDPWTEHLPSID